MAKQTIQAQKPLVKLSAGPSKRQSEVNAPLQPKERVKTTLKQRTEKQYPFLDTDVPKMFDDLLQAGLIQLLEMKRPDQANRVNDPNYCKYHRLIGHPIEKCFVFKDKIMEMHRAGEVAFEGETALANLTSVVDPSPQKVQFMVKFGSFEPVQLKTPQLSQPSHE